MSHLSMHQAVEYLTSYCLPFVSPASRSSSQAEVGWKDRPGVARQRVLGRGAPGSLLIIWPITYLRDLNHGGNHDLRPTHSYNKVIGPFFCCG